jgi:hypothetical protein
MHTGRGVPEDSCDVGVPSGVNISNRRFVVDETIGSVVAFCTFGAGNPNGGSGAPDSHLFRMESGKLRYVHTITHLIQANFRGGVGAGGGQRGGAAGAGAGGARGGGAPAGAPAGAPGTKIGARPLVPHFPAGKWGTRGLAPIFLVYLTVGGHLAEQHHRVHRHDRRQWQELWCLALPLRRP